jgi:hypothetical protein
MARRLNIKLYFRYNWLHHNTMFCKVVLHKTLTIQNLLDWWRAHPFNGFFQGLVYTCVGLAVRNTGQKKQLKPSCTLISEATFIRKWAKDSQILVIVETNHFFFIFQFLNWTCTFFWWRIELFPILICAVVCVNLLIRVIFIRQTIS